MIAVVRDAVHRSAYVTRQLCCKYTAIGADADGRVKDVCSCVREQRCNVTCMIFVKTRRWAHVAKSDLPRFGLSEAKMVRTLPPKILKNTKRKVSTSILRHDFHFPKLDKNMGVCWEICKF